MSEKDNSKEKTLSKPATPKKKTFWDQVKPDINSDFTDIAVYLVKDVLKPAMKDTLYAFFNNFLNAVIYGDRYSQRNPGPKNSYDSPRYVNYADRYNNNRYSQSSRSSVYDYTELEYDSRYDAEVVLYKIKDILERQRFVSVGDLFEASEVRPTSADYDYGWTSLAGVEPRPSRNGKFYLTLSRPMPIER